MLKPISLKALRPAFVATGVLAVTGCTPRPLTNPPPPTPTTAVGEPAGGGSTAEADARRKKFGVHPRDAENHLIMRKSGGECYVQVPKAGPPPSDMMSGERWVEDKVVTCPKEFDDPAFAAISDGSYWIQDEATGECSQAQTFGNPPPPPVVVPCPPVLQKKK